MSNARFVRGARSADFCSGHKCGHLITVNGGRWPDEMRLSDLEPLFICSACSKRGADVRPDFNWNRPVVPMMAYRPNTSGAVSFKSLTKAPVLSTALLATDRRPGLLSFARGLRGRSRIRLRSRRRVTDWLGLSTDRLRLRIANRFGKHLEQIGLSLRRHLLAHRPHSVTG